MKCSINSLSDKDVISVNDGMKIGTVGDVEFDTETGCITALIISGKAGFFGMIGKSEDTRIDWSNIEVVGDDTILVKCADFHSCPNKGKLQR